MGQQQAYGFIHEVSLILQTLAWLQALSAQLLTRAIDSSDALRAG
jgi:hypothetical protein